LEHEGKTASWDSGDISFARAVAGMLAIRFSADQKQEPVEDDASGDHQPAVDRAAPVKPPEAESSRPQSPATSAPPDGRPASLSARLLSRGYDQNTLAAEVFGDATVMVLRFTDLLSIAEQADDKDTTPLADHIVQHFEALIDEYAIDYWKVMGDQIVCAAGLGDKSNEHARHIADVALGLQNRCTQIFADLDKRLGFRIGIDIGAVVGSLVGKRQRSFNVWGEAVRAAETMAESGVTGGIHVSEAAYRRLQKDYLFKMRGKFYLSGIGEIFTYLLTGRL
jgi:class 3 adenylate cyclase